MKKVICKDSFGNRIYPGDIVELFIGFETHTPWESEVYWNMLDGAFVNSHPAHIIMGLSTHRNLRDFINKEDVEVGIVGGGTETVKTYCKKIKK